MRKIQIEAIYGFVPIFENVDKTLVASEEDGNVLTFDSTVSFMRFLLDNKFVLREVGDHMLVVTRDKEPNIYGRMVKQGDKHEE